MKYFLSIFIILNLIVMPAYSSELLEKGAVLEEDSVVFTVEEAQEMAQYISKLELTVAQKDDLLEQKDSLLENKDDQVQSFEEYLDLQDQQIAKYLEIQAIDSDRIKSLDRRARFKKLETAGAFIGGVAVAVTLIIVADQLDDRLLESNLSPEGSAARIRF